MSGGREPGNNSGGGSGGDKRAGKGRKRRGQQDKQSQYNGPQPVIEGSVFNYMGCVLLTNLLRQWKEYTVTLGQTIRNIPPTLPMPWMI